MKLIVQKDLFSDYVNKLAKVINRNTPLPILNAILCEVKDQEMRLTASDSEITLSATVGLDVMEGDGRFCVMADELTAALAELTNQPLTLIINLEDANPRFTMTHDSGETYFTVYNADEYPQPMAEKYDNEITLPGELLQDMIHRASYSMANDDLRPIMCGECFCLQDGFLDIVASDGHTMIRNQASVADVVSMEDKARFVIPAKAVGLLDKLLQSIPAVVRWNDTRCEVVQCGFYISLRLVDGTYPNYNSIIPEDTTMTAITPRALMICSLRKVLPFSSSSSNMVKMTVGNSHLRLESDDYDFSHGSHDTITVDCIADPLTIGFNGKMMLGLLSRLPGQTIDICLRDASHSIMLVPSDPELDYDVLMIIMPLMLDD